MEYSVDRTCIKYNRRVMEPLDEYVPFSIQDDDRNIVDASHNVFQQGSISMIYLEMPIQLDVALRLRGGSPDANNDSKHNEIPYLSNMRFMWSGLPSIDFQDLVMNPLNNGLGVGHKSTVAFDVGSMVRKTIRNFNFPTEIHAALVSGLHVL